MSIPPVPFLFIPLICYNRLANTSYVMSLMKLILALKEKGISATVYPITFESLISRARNAAVAQFLSTKEATHILFIDSDIEFNHDDVFRLLDVDKPVVAGTYPLKFYNFDKLRIVLNIEPKQDNHMELAGVIPEQPLLPGISSNVNVQEADSQGLIKVDYATTGFMLIKRQVFEQLIQKYPEIKYNNDIDGYMGADKDSFYNFFPSHVNEKSRKYESEDFGFCRLWRDSNAAETSNNIYILEDISLIHHGWNGFSGNLAHQKRIFKKVEETERERSKTTETTNVIKPPTFNITEQPMFQVI